jgi:RNA polymerase sigma-70 factor (ECF subfamily)
MASGDVHETIDAVWRIESAKLIAALARMTGDVGVAEDLAQDALVVALEKWPATGVPDNPGAWLMATAKNRAIDGFRREKLHERTHPLLSAELDLQQGSLPEPGASLDDHVGDDLLGLIFAACHPVLSAEARTALTLRLLGGLTTDEIARAFLVPEPTIAQRIVRAKKTLREAQVTIEVPAPDALAERLSSVLGVIYLIFNEGYSATAGEEWMRPALAEEGLRLGRILARLMPKEREVHGLVALMELQASRLGARVDVTGQPILLLDQDRSRWDRLLIARGLAALERADSSEELPGSYTIQAAIAACHATAPTGDATDWARIVSLYDLLGIVAPSPVVTLNRAVALGMLQGPEAGLGALAPLEREPAMAQYYLLPAIRGDFFFKLGRFEEARSAFQRAASLTRNARERALMLKRAAACEQGRS